MTTRVLTGFFNLTTINSRSTRPDYILQWVRFTFLTEPCRSYGRLRSVSTTSGRGFEWWTVSNFLCGSPRTYDDITGMTGMNLGRSTNHIFELTAGRSSMVGETRSWFEYWVTGNPIAASPQWNSDRGRAQPVVRWTFGRAFATILFFGPALTRFSGAIGLERLRADRSRLLPENSTRVRNRQSVRWTVQWVRFSG